MKQYYTYLIINSYFSYLPLSCNNLKGKKKKKTRRGELKCRRLLNFPTIKHLLLYCSVLSKTPKLNSSKDLPKKRSTKLPKTISKHNPIINKDFWTSVSTNNRCELKLKTYTRKKSLLPSVQMFLPTLCMLEKQGRSFLQLKEESKILYSTFIEKISGKMVLQRSRSEIWLNYITLQLLYH